MFSAFVPPSNGRIMGPAIDGGDPLQEKSRCGDATTCR